MSFEEFIKRVQDRARLSTWRDALRATGATLETLARRIVEGEAEDLAARLPSQVGCYMTHVRHRERFDLKDFYRKVSEKEHVPIPDAEVHARAVVSVLREAVSPGEMEDIRAELPEEYDYLFEPEARGGLKRTEDLMKYKEFTREVQKLDFISDPDKADSAVKAVLGILASRMSESQALQLTEKLPYPLTIEKLRVRQAREVMIPVRAFFSEVGAQFGLTEDQAHVLVNTVLHLTKEAVGEPLVTELEKQLPIDWAMAFEDA